MIPKGIVPSNWDKKVSVKGSKILVISDLHIPFHHDKAIEKMLEYVKKNHSDIDTLYINGDYSDFSLISRFSKERNMLTMLEEVKIGKVIFKEIMKHLPNVKNTYYKIGNHEHRFDLYIRDRIPELIDINLIGIESILNQMIDNYTLVQNDQYAHIGKLTIIHGHELSRGLAAPVNPARGLYMKAKISAIMGHSHRISVHTEKTLEGKYIKTWSMGCLCHLSPRYWTNNSWQLGFAIIDNSNENGRDFFNVNNYQILDTNDLIIVE